MATDEERRALEKTRIVDDIPGDVGRERKVAEGENPGAGVTRGDMCPQHWKMVGDIREMKGIMETNFEFIKAGMENHRENIGRLFGRMDDLSVHMAGIEKCVRANSDPGRANPTRQKNPGMIVGMIMGLGIVGMALIDIIIKLWRFIKPIG